jgi:hypothetical protein
MLTLGGVLPGGGLVARRGGWVGGVALTMTHNNNMDPPSILLSLNNASKYDLPNPINLALGNSNDTNPYLENKLNTLYYDLHLPPSLITLPNSITFLSLNIRSLMSNHSHLNSIVTNFLSNEEKIGAIALQEVWSVPYPELVSIDGFTFISNTRKKSRGGGVGFYLCDNIKYKVLNDLSIFLENKFESLTVEITVNRKKILLGNYYRPPSANNDNFFNNLNNYLNNLHRRNVNTCVFSDTNINLLKLPNSNLATEYLETVHSNGFLQLICKATRINDNSYSLIDHI